MQYFRVIQARRPSCENRNQPVVLVLVHHDELYIRNRLGLKRGQELIDFRCSLYRGQYEAETWHT